MAGSRVCGGGHAWRWAARVHVEYISAAQAARSTTYASEFFVRHVTTVDDFEVKIQGRIDGVHPPRHGEAWVIEEIKSLVVGPLVFAALDAKSHPHHLEQLRLYGYFLEQENKTAIGKLVYVNITDGLRKEFEIAGPFVECRQLIVDRVRALIASMREQERQRAERRLRVAALKFPHEKPRRYQDQMMAAVDAALEKGRHLLVSAPSGIGKTAGALYPAIKYALANDKRVFFVTAKNTQHEQAAETSADSKSPARSSCAPGPACASIPCTPAAKNSVRTCRCST